MKDWRVGFLQRLWFFVSLAFSLLLLFSFTTTQAVDLKGTAQSFKEFDYNKSTDFSAIGDMVRNDMMGQHHEVSSTITATANKFMSDYGQANPPTSAQMLNSEERKGYHDKQNSALKEHLKSEMSKEYSQRMESYLRDHLLKDATGKDKAQVEQMIANVKTQAEARAKEAVEKSVANWQKATEENARQRGQANYKPLPDDYLARDLSGSLMSQTGEITKDGLKEFADKQMQDTMGIKDIKEVGGFIDDKMHIAGNMLDKVSDELGVSELKDKLSVGELEKQIQKVLDKSGLPNPFNLKAGDYISSAKDALNNAVGVDLPVVELPANAYSVIQIASGVGHFMRSIGFLYINPDEIRKGRNCLDVANWSMTEKNRMFRIIGGRLRLVDAFEVANKYTGASAAIAGAAGIDPAAIDKLKGVIDKVQNFDLKDLAKTKLGLGEVINELGEVKSKIDEGIAKVKDGAMDKLGDLADKTGVKETYEEMKKVKEQAKEEADRFRKNIEEKRKKIEEDLGLEKVKDAAEKIKVNQGMSTSKEAKDFIKSYEKLKLNLYDSDGGDNTTIGYGHLVHYGKIDGSEPEEFKKGITKKLAEEIFENDIKACEKIISRSIKAQLSQKQFDALISLVFNLGHMPKSLSQKINKGEEIKEGDFKTYNKSGVKVLRGLTNRRIDEYELYNNGDYKRDR